ncbi:interferon alpha-inducible protein 27-like protein 2 [Indicator indicator]|uniref:interferon alpha-inducible protein 27-like protein 2 n=1 Tax=Indicator indicator TaxID=1002788 RepID=UPI0023DF055D|nr:interferon alpha-inducible protein 27-like protein 2 [Indicator indicator]
MVPVAHLIGAFVVICVGVGVALYARRATRMGHSSQEDFHFSEPAGPHRDVRSAWNEPAQRGRQGKQQDKKRGRKDDQQDSEEEEEQQDLQEDKKQWAGRMRRWQAGRMRRQAGRAAVGRVALVGIPAGIFALGFTGSGIAAGSIAAKMMSAAAIANGGGVAAGSLVSVLQSVGAAGFSVATKIGLASTLGSVGGVVGDAVGRAVSAASSPKPPDDKSNQNQQGAKKPKKWPSPADEPEQNQEGS